MFSPVNVNPIRLVGKSIEPVTSPRELHCTRHPPEDPGTWEVAKQIVTKIGTHALRTQLLSGQPGIKAYLKRFKLADDPFCTCDDVTPETILHILLECMAWSVTSMSAELIKR
ncbi:TRAS3 protein [Operophtera brumata]|uniref:TRAS3 protein n=1 Tax=Operophtera brumata TaxID=104452 RepID=A0A0L7LMZ0_OPEBR|nr:TRAS3 protein [Operophtera brumata]